MKKTTHHHLIQAIFIALLLLFLPAVLAAQQTDKSNSIQVHVGFQFNQIQDLVFTPMIYKGSALGVLGVAYEQIKKKHLRQISFAYSTRKNFSN